MNPLLFKVNGVPRILHFHAWLLRRGLYITQASAIARTAMELAEYFECSPSEITREGIQKFIEQNSKNGKVTQSIKWIYPVTIEKYREFARMHPNGVPLDWDTTTGMIGDVLGWKSRRVVTSLKHYAVSVGKDIEDFRCGNKMYRAPLAFYAYVEQEKIEYENRILTPKG